MPALEGAVHIPVSEGVSRSIVTITGGYLSGEKEIFDIIHQNSGNMNFFSFGIGSSVNRYLIDGIAKAGSGESFVVTDPAETWDTTERFRTYIESPILTVCPIFLILFRSISGIRNQIRRKPQG